MSDPHDAKLEIVTVKTSDPNDMSGFEQTSLSQLVSELQYIEPQPVTYAWDGTLQHWYSSGRGTFAATASTATPGVPPSGAFPMSIPPESGYHLQAEVIDVSHLQRYVVNGRPIVSLPTTISSRVKATASIPRQPYPNPNPGPIERFDMALVAAVVVYLVVVLPLNRVRARMNGLRGGRAEGDGRAVQPPPGEGHIFAVRGVT